MARLTKNKIKEEEKGELGSGKPYDECFEVEGVGPVRGLRGGGRRGWCEEWARSG